jgi:hypothetical protein
VRDPALDYKVAPHLVGVVAQVVALLGHVFMLPPARAGPHWVLFGLGEVTADAGELGGGGLGEDDRPVRVLPSERGSPRSSGGGSRQPAWRAQNGPPRAWPAWAPRGAGAAHACATRPVETKSGPPRVMRLP